MSMKRLRQVLVATAISLGFALSAMADGLALKTSVKVQELHPFTHLASIPAGADPSSFKFESVKLVSVATQSKSVIDERGCDEATQRDPGGSIDCSYTAFQALSPAYEVTYSYLGQTMAADEYGSNHFTFSVYLRPEELSPAVQQALSEHKMGKAAAAGFFELNTSRDSVRQVRIDELASKFCNGNFLDGSWMHTDSKCDDQISYKTITAPSSYITVKVDPVSSTSAQKSAR
jgi:hypothetical protein